jgi:hypothetical protein
MGRIKGKMRIVISQSARHSDILRYDDRATSWVVVGLWIERRSGGFGWCHCHWG